MKRKKAESVKAWCGFCGKNRRLALWTMQDSLKECWLTIQKYRMGLPIAALKKAGWRVVRVTIAED